MKGVAPNNSLSDQRADTTTTAGTRPARSDPGGRGLGDRRRRDLNHLGLPTQNIGRGPCIAARLQLDLSCLLLLVICFWRAAPEAAIGSDRRAGKWGLFTISVSGGTAIFLQLFYMLSLGGKRE